ncbi:MAG: hypothetical protein HPY50_09010 [Firmicutes bacterium]|nr:hypothetical protein [Bacillota bacterium]
MPSQKMLEALKTALEHEKHAMEMYRRMAQQAEDAETRLLMEQIAREEEGHYNQLSKRLKALRLLG